MKEQKYIPELSRVDRYGSLWLDEKDCPCNTPLAERYHKLLGDELRLNVVGSHAYFALDQLSIHLWISKSNPDSFQVETPFHTRTGDELCDRAVECLKRILSEEGVFLPSREQILAEYAKRNQSFAKEGPDSCLYIYSYDWEIYSTFMYEAKEEINRLIRRRFAYWDVECMFTTTESFRVYENQKHVFVFRCQYDIERAKRDGILDTLLEEAYKIVKKHDKHGTVTRETYDPDIVSRDRFSGEMLFNMARD